MIKRTILALCASLFLTGCLFEQSETLPPDYILLTNEKEFRWQIPALNWTSMVAFDSQQKAIENARQHYEFRNIEIDKWTPIPYTDPDTNSVNNVIVLGSDIRVDNRDLMLYYGGFDEVPVFKSTSCIFASALKTVASPLRARSADKNIFLKLI